MHIPDGYLGPLTFIVLYAIMIPIWLYAGYWVQKSLRTRQVPYLALGAAFSFVIMMFNVPVPGGSSGHAVGSALVAIILGPWAAVVTTTCALLIQCLIFGDGGITAFGANCFNMGVVIPFVAYYTYKLISRKSPIASNLRIAAAAIGAYIGLSVAAGSPVLKWVSSRFSSTLRQECPSTCRTGSMLRYRQCLSSIWLSSAGWN